MRSWPKNMVSWVLNGMRLCWRKYPDWSMKLKVLVMKVCLSIPFSTDRNTYAIALILKFKVLAVS